MPLSTPPCELEEELEESLPIDDPLDESILEILGAVETKQKGTNLHKEIVSRWIEVIENGLKKEEKDEIIKTHLPFENCPQMCTPKLNPEVKAALPEAARKRDQIIETRQKQVSTVLSCLGMALQGCINGADHKEILEKIMNASKLLCDTLHLDSKGRRSLILFCINKDMKESLLQTKPQEYLFGKDLSEQIKTAKSVQKSVQDLKVPQKKPNVVIRNVHTPVKTNARALNWRGPPRQGVRTQKPGGPSYRGRAQTRKKEEGHHERQPHRNTRR